MSIYAWENIKEVTYRSELIDGVEVIYPISSNRCSKQWFSAAYFMLENKLFLARAKFMPVLPICVDLFAEVW